MVFQRLTRQLEIGKPRDQCRQRHLPFEARQRCPDAEMDPVAERQVAVVGASEVQPVGLGKPTRIPIRRAEPKFDEVSRANPRTAQRQVVRRQPRGHLGRTVVAEQLLDGRSDQCRIASQPPQLIWVAQQCKQPVADQVGRRLVPADQEDHAGRQQFVGRQGVAPLFDGDETADEIVARLSGAIVPQRRRSRR